MSIIAEALKKAQQKRSETSDISEILFKTPAESPDISPACLPEPRKTGGDSRIFIPRISIPKIASLNPMIIIAILSLVILTGVAAGFLVRAGSGPSYDPAAEKTLETPAAPAAKYYVSAAKPSPSSSSKKRTSLPIVSGIMYSPRNPQAIVNGMLASEGSTIDGFVLTKILPDTVRVKRGDSEYELKLR